MSAHFYSVCLLVCVPLFLSAPFCFCLHPFVYVCALYSVCTLFHFTYDDFSFRKGHIKSDFLSIHHMSLHTFILSSCPRPFVSVRALLFLSGPFCFGPRPFVSVRTLSSVCILFHFTHHDFSFRKGHIKSDFLSLHHYVSAHFCSVCLHVRALLFLSAPFCFCLFPFFCLHSFSFYLWWFFL